MTIIKQSGAAKHSYQPAPMCLGCIDRGFVYWDHDCPDCLDLVTSSESPLSGSEVFALLRQWSPSVQCCIEMLTHKALELGVGVNDCDEVTGMTLLHYACIAAALGQPKTHQDSLALVAQLIEMGAELKDTRWIRMNPLQFAVFFDTHQVVKFLLERQIDADVEQRCPEFFSGTLLHLAAFSGSTEAAKVLLQMGADPTALDNLGLTPAEVAERTVDKFPEDSQLKREAAELVSLLSTAANLKKQLQDSNESVSLADILLADRGLSVGCRVRIKGNKTGTLRFCGDVQFAQGKWIGVELDLPTGKHDGSVDDVRYFHCAQGKGVFVPVKCVEKLKKPSETKFGYAYSLNANLFKKDADRSSLDLTEFIRTERNSVELGSEVLVGNRQKGVVRYIGETHFAKGLWYGIELDTPVGRNNGAVDGTVYFRCPTNCGIFAPPDKVIRLNDAIIKDDLTATSHANRQTNRAEVIVTGLNAKGVIRYVGAVDFAPGIWFGLELDSPVGTNDGEVLGRRYFRCPCGYGMFVKPTKVKPI